MKKLLMILPVLFLFVATTNVVLAQDATPKCCDIELCKKLCAKDASACAKVVATKDASCDPAKCCKPGCCKGESSVATKEVSTNAKLVAHKSEAAVAVQGKNVNQKPACAKKKCCAKKPK